MLNVMKFSPVEYEHVEPQAGPRKAGQHGRTERFLEGEHPGLLWHGEVQVVLVSVPEEDVLQSRAPSLVSFSKGNL